MEYKTSHPVSSTPYLRRPVLELTRELPPNARVLDVGCGNGYWAGLFQQQGCTAVGIDPSASGIEIARATYPGARFERIGVSHDILDRLGEDAFDLVISTEVIEHLYDPSMFAAACFTALRPGGRIVVSTPFHGHLKNVVLAVTGKFDAHHDALRVGGHVKFFSRKTLECLLRESGFVKLTFVGAGRAPYLWKSMVIRADRPS